MKNIDFKLFCEIEGLRQEAIRLDYAKQYTREWGNLSGGRHQYDKWFGTDDFGKPIYRYYIDIANGNSLMKNPPTGWTRIKDELFKYGYKIISYEAGRCAKINDDRNEFRIGKIIARLSPEVINLYNRLMDEDSKELIEDENELLLVISRHPYDIIGMSTDREKWDSCTAIPEASLGKYRKPEEHRMDMAKWSVVEYIRSNSLIAYIIKANDFNITNPIGRVIIYPYETHTGKWKDGVDGERYMRISDKHYGRFSDNVRKILQNWLDERQGKLNLKKRYRSDDNHYMDDNPTELTTYSDKEIIEKYVIGKVKKKLNGLYDVDGDVCFNDSYFSELPIKFGTVNGDFECDFTKLKTLKGCPHTVNGNFTCQENKIINLEGGPVKVMGRYDCSHNYNLVSLKGSPEFVGTEFSCSLDEALTNLKDGPLNAKSYNYSMCRRLKSLEGSPEVVNDKFDISYCFNLKSYKGGPKVIHGLLDMAGDSELRDFIQYLEKAKSINVYHMGFTEREVEALRDKYIDSAVYNANR